MFDLFWVKRRRVYHGGVVNHATSLMSVTCRVRPQTTILRPASLSQKYECHWKAQNAEMVLLHAALFFVLGGSSLSRPATGVGRGRCTGCVLGLAHAGPG